MFRSIKKCFQTKPMRFMSQHTYAHGTAAHKEKSYFVNKVCDVLTNSNYWRKWKKVLLYQQIFLHETPTKTFDSDFLLFAVDS